MSVRVVKTAVVTRRTEGACSLVYKLPCSGRVCGIRQDERAKLHPPGNAGYKNKPFSCPAAAEKNAAGQEKRLIAF